MVDYRHLHGDTYLDGFDHGRKAGQQLRWLVTRDDPIPPGAPLAAVFKMMRKFEPRQQTQFRCKVVVSAADRPPTRLASLPDGADGVQIIDIPYNMSLVPIHQCELVRMDDRTFHKAVVELQIWITVEDERTSTLAAEFRLLCAGQELARERAIL